MLMQSIESYLALRRSLGFGLSMTERLLRNFARFAAERGETHMRTQTSIGGIYGLRFKVGIFLSGSSACRSLIQSSLRSFLSIFLIRPS